MYKIQSVLMFILHGNIGTFSDLFQQNYLENFIV